VIIANNIYVGSDQDVVLDDEFRTFDHGPGNICTRPNNNIIPDRYAVSISGEGKRSKLSMRTEPEKLPATEPAPEALRMQ
jgi:hypothetical protein